MTKKRIKVALLTSLACRSEGGLAYSIPAMVNLMRKSSNIELKLFAPTDDNSDASDFGDFVPSSVRLKNSFRFSSELYKNLVMWQPDIIDIQGLWTYHAIAGYCAAKRLNIPYVVTPRGMLDVWAMQRSRLKKYIPNILYMKPIIRGSSGLRVTSKAELDGLPLDDLKQKAFLIPNNLVVSDEKFTKEYGSRRAMFLSRIHPKKGLLELLKAWSLIGPDNTNWSLDIYGDFNNTYGTKCRKYANSNCENITWHGEVHGRTKHEAFLNADLFVFPTYSENFSNVVLEAMQYGIPVITTKESCWGNLDLEKIGWITSNTPYELSLKIKDVLRLSTDELQQTGNRAKEYVHNEYSSDKIRQMLADFYEIILLKGM